MTAENKLQSQINTYTKDRLESCQHWYSNKANNIQCKYNVLRYSEIVLAGLIPVVALIPFFSEHSDYSKFIMGGLGAAVGIIAAVLNNGQFQKLWPLYRNISEQLKSEKVQFDAECGEYCESDEKKRFCKLVKRVESLIANEHDKWQGFKKSNNDKPKK